MTATFFGHKDTPKEIEPTLRTTLVELIENHNASVFYVGNNGNFDTMVRRLLKELSQVYPITYSVVLAYLPTKQNLHPLLPYARKYFLLVYQHQKHAKDEPNHN